VLIPFVFVIPLVSSALFEEEFKEVKLVLGKDKELFRDEDEFSFSNKANEDDKESIEEDEEDSLFFVVDLPILFLRSPPSILLCFALENGKLLPQSCLLGVHIWFPERNSIAKKKPVQLNYEFV